MEGDITYFSCTNFMLQLVTPLNPRKPENPQANYTSLGVTFSDWRYISKPSDFFA